MHNKPILWLLLFFVFLTSCQTINRDRAELGIPKYMVIFSFDDGPDAHTTPKLLDVLKKYQIRALFCLLGVNAAQYPNLVRRIHDEGHYIVNHGYSGKWASRMNNEEFRNDLIRGEEAISAALGFDLHPRLYRPHGGFYRARHERIWTNEAYAFVPVTVRVHDAVASAARQDRIVRRTIRKIERQSGGIILLHDGRDSHYRRAVQLEKNPDGAFNRSWIPDAVEEIITALLAMGFILNEPGILAAIGLDY